MALIATLCVWPSKWSWWGIDCAFGWPDEFVQFVTGHRAGSPLGAEASGDRDWRRTLAYRATDRAVHARTGRWPLSVATDRLGLTALRCAGAAGCCGGGGRAGRNRSGAPPSRVVEVYPAAALRCWGIRQAGYKNDVARRAQVLDELARGGAVARHRGLSRGHGRHERRPRRGAVGARGGVSRSRGRRMRLPSRRTRLRRAKGGSPCRRRV